VRLGLLGPANGDLAALAQTAEFLLNGAKVTRAIYLGADEAIEDTVALWAESLVGPDASDQGVWKRAFPVAASGTTEELDTFLRAERARLRLKAIERLPPEELRTVEMLGEHVAVLIHDKALLDEEDIFSATILVYGKSDGALLKPIGSRWFMTPGPAGGPGCGAMVLDDSGEELVAMVYDAEGRMAQRETLSTRRSTKMSVQG